MSTAESCTQLVIYGWSNNCRFHLLIDHSSKGASPVSGPHSVFMSPPPHLIKANKLIKKSVQQKHYMGIASFQVHGNGCNEDDSGRRREKPKGVQISKWRYVLAPQCGRLNDMVITVSTDAWMLCTGYGLNRLRRNEFRKQEGAHRKLTDVPMR